MLHWLRSKLAPASHAPAPGGPLALYRAGRTDEAASLLVARLQSDPSDIEGLLVQGLLALDRGQAAAAHDPLARAAELAPGRADVKLALGRAYLGIGRRPAAQAAFESALALDCSSGEPPLQLALLALAGGRRDEAQRLLSDAAAKDPRLAEAQFHLGNLMRERGQLDEAEDHYLRAIESRPGHAQALSNLGGLLKDRGRNDEAAVYLEQAITLDPGLAAAPFNLAMLRIDQRRWSDAVDLLRKSLAADARQADAQYWLGNALMGSGEVDEARNAYQAAVRLQADYLQARWGYALAQLPAIPRTDAEQIEAAASFRREFQDLIAWFRAREGTVGGYAAVGSQQPYYLAYIAQDHRALLADYGSLCVKLMDRWARKVGVPPPSRERRAKHRVGVVSAHIHGHSVWHAIVRGWVEHLDRTRFDLHLFHTGATFDAETQWASGRAAQLHHGTRDWAGWAKTIADNRLDALIYPEIGMDATAVRLAALRLARVQLASWGHPITTGLPTIDGFISAESLEPAGAEAHYTEPLMTLPRLGCCYLPFGTQPAAVAFASFGIRPEDRVLLCAGTPFKYAPRYDALLADIARRCRPCKLIFFRGQPESLSVLMEERLRKSFEHAGAGFEESVRFIPWQSQAEFFGWLDRADVYLDSPGFSGFNTAMQAIERATPIVAWEGEFLRGRFASGILRRIGLDQWVTDSEQGYAERIERLCADASLRDEVRGKMGERRASLFDDRAAVAALGERLAALLSAA